MNAEIYSAFKLKSALVRIMKTLDKMLKTDDLLSVEDVLLDLTKALQCDDWTDLKSMIEEIQTCINIAHRTHTLDGTIESNGTIDLDFGLHNINDVYYKLVSHSYEDSDAYEAAALLIMKDRVKSCIKLCNKMLASNCAVRC